MGYLSKLWGKFAPSFNGSKNYWEARYQKGGNSGIGSYGEYANFKSGVINDFLNKNQIKTVIEFGCGDGNQLSLLKIENYTGYDVSRTAVNLCKEKFKNDPFKSFRLLHPNEKIEQKAELCLSLDVIFHLIEDHVYESHMIYLFENSERFVIIYSTNYSGEKKASHVKHRNFTSHISGEFPNWKLIEQIDNDLPFVKRKDKKDVASFFIYERVKS